MKIVVYCDGDEVFRGDSEQMIADNDGDESVIEMIEEVKRTGESICDIMHSGTWEIRAI